MRRWCWPRLTDAEDLWGVSVRRGEGKGTDLVPDDKGTDEDEGDGCEKDDGGEDAHGLEHLPRVSAGAEGSCGSTCFNWVANYF